MPEKTMFATLNFSSVAHARGLSTYAQAKAAAAFLDTHPWDPQTGRMVGAGVRDYNPTPPLDANQNAQNGIQLEIGGMTARDPDTGETYQQWDLCFNDPAITRKSSAGMILHVLELDGTAEQALALKGFERDLQESGQLPVGGSAPWIVTIGS